MVRHLCHYIFPFFDEASHTAHRIVVCYLELSCDTPSFEIINCYSDIHFPSRLRLQFPDFVSFSEKIGLEEISKGEFIA